MSDFKVGDTLYHHFSTRAFATGIPTTLAGSPVAEAYEEANATGLTAGVSLTIDHAETGHHLLTVVATGGNSFETGKSYGVSLTAGTVDSVSVVGEVIFNFSLEKSPAAQDLANGTDGLTVLKTGIDGIPTTAEFEARTIVAANYFDPGADTVATVTTVTNQLSAATVANQVWDTDATGRQTAGTFGQAIGDPGADTDTIYGAVVTGAAGANIAVDVIAVKAETALIVADTNELQVDWVNGGRLDLLLDAIPTTAMRGTDSAALASVCTEGRLAELDAANLPSTTDDILTDTAVIGALGAGLTDITDRLPAALTKGTADSGTTTTMVDAVRTEADTDYWAGDWIRFTSGTISGQARRITAFTPASDTITFAPATTQAVATNTYEILPAGATGVDWGEVIRATTAVDLSATDIQLCDTVTTLTGHPVQTGDSFARLGAPAGACISADILVIDNFVDGIETAVITNAAGADIAADIIALKAETVLIVADTNELQTDDVPGLIAALNDISTAQVNTEVDTALDTTIAELSQGVPATTPTVRTALMLMYMALRNKLDVATVATDTLEIHNDAGTRITQKLLTDDGADYSEAKMTSGA